jgi:hypothetical protein
MCPFDLFGRGLISQNGTSAWGRRRIGVNLTSECVIFPGNQPLQ